MPPCVKRKFNDDWLLGIMNLMTVRGMRTVKNPHFETFKQLQLAYAKTDLTLQQTKQKLKRTLITHVKPEMRKI